MGRYLSAAIAACLAAGAAAAEPLGWSVAISNDSIGEFRDRWQSSSVQAGLAFGTPGRALELRFRSDILTPADLDMPAPDDRRHAGVLAFGLHAHRTHGRVETRIGGDVVVVGPQTGLLDLQEELHRILGFEIPRLDDFQIEDRMRLDLSGEVGRRIAWGGGVLRPFAEAQAGSEDLVRLGVDLTFGPLAGRGLMTRAVTTGHRVPMDFGGADGFSWTLGADVAWVGESLYLPEALGYEPTGTRNRLRAGAHLKRGRLDVFYGLAWLGEEFEAQPEGQFVGTVQARWDF